MNEALLKPCTAFDGNRRLASGPLGEVALAVKRAGPPDSVYIYDDATGEVIDLDTRGTEDEVLQRLEERLTTRGRGRPKLGVVAREVTLLPRHWDWLNAQPGGASVALRRLVDEARRTNLETDRRRTAQEAAYRFVSAIGGNLPGFEEATRALFAYDRGRFEEQISEWPEDVRAHAVKLAFVS